MGSDSGILKPRKDKSGNVMRIAKDNVKKKKMGKERRLELELHVWIASWLVPSIAHRKKTT